METGLVSICSPCYNVAPYIPRFLDSLLAQTYKQLEIILVNDGATDETGAVIESYRPRLEAQGYRVIYLVQENGGQASAINRALKHVHGEFLTWPDPDDWLTPDSIEVRARFLQQQPEVGLVRGNAEIIAEADGKSLGTFESTEGAAYEIPGFAEKLILTHTWYAPVAVMLRMSAFLQVNPERDIYTPKKGGQNLQLMLPMVCRFPHRQLPQVLGYYLRRESSHSHEAKTWEARMAYIDVWENVVLHEIARDPAWNRKWRRMALEEFGEQRYWLSLRERRLPQARQYLKDFRKNFFSYAYRYGLTLLPAPLCRVTLWGQSLGTRLVGKIRRSLHR